jgi:hypothetical protein
VPEASENGAKIGRLIHSRAAVKGMRLRDVAKTLNACGNFYLITMDRIDTELSQENDDEALGGGVQQTAEEKKERKKLKKVARLMMNFWTAAIDEFEKAMNGLN